MGMNGEQGVGGAAWHCVVCSSYSPQRAVQVTGGGLERPVVLIGLRDGSLVRRPLRTVLGLRPGDAAADRRQRRPVAESQVTSDG